MNITDAQRKASNARDRQIWLMFEQNFDKKGNNEWFYKRWLRWLTKSLYKKLTDKLYENTRPDYEDVRRFVFYTLARKYDELCLFHVRNKAKHINYTFYQIARAIEMHKKFGVNLVL